MGMTTSELSIKVKSDGIAQAAIDLTKLAEAAKSVDAETRSFVVAQQKLAASGKEANSVKKQLTASDREAILITKQLAAEEKARKLVEQKRDIEQYTQAVNARIEAEKRVIKELEAQKAIQQKRDYETHLAKTREANIAEKERAKALKASSEELEHVNRRGNVYVNTLRSMATAALAYVGVNFFTDVVKQADAWSLAQSKLKLATGSMEGAIVAQKDLYDISQKLRVPLEDTTKLFTRMMVPLQKMGKTSSDAKEMVSAFSTALKLSGATGQEAASAMLQFSQSLNAGRLNGGEFNSIAEASPNILRAVEAEFKRLGVSIEGTSGGLKKLAADGKITTEILYNAIKNASPKWAKEFETLPLTVDGALTRIKNAWGKAIGELGQDTKFNEKMAASLKKLEEMLPSIAKAIVGVFSFVVDNGDVILKVFAGIASATVLFSIGSLATKMWLAYQSVVAVTGAVGGLTKAFALIGITPVGAALVVLGAAIAGGITLWNKYKESMENATKENQPILDASQARIDKLKAEIIETKKLIDVSRLKMGLPAMFSEEEKGIKKELAGIDKGYSDALGLYKNYITAKNKYEADEKVAAKAKREGDPTAFGTSLVAKESSEKLKVAQSAYLSQLKLYNEEVLLTKQKASGEEIRVTQGLSAQLMEIQNKQEESLKTAYQKATEKKEKRLADLKNETRWTEKMLENERKLIDKEFNEAVDKIKTPKSEKEADKNLKAHLDRMIDMADKLRNVRTELEGMQKFGVDWEKMLPEEKAFANISNNMSSLISKIGFKRAEEEKARAGEIEAAAKEKRSLEEKIANQLKGIELAKSGVQSAQDELTKNEELFASEEKRVEILAKIAAAKAYDNYQTKLIDPNAHQKEIDLLYQEYLIRQKNAEIVVKKVEKDESQKQYEDAKKYLDDLFDTKKVDKWENATSKALKGMVKNVVDLTKAFEKYSAKRETIKEGVLKLADIEKKSGKESLEYLDFKDKLQRKSDDYQLASYAELSDAAKNFFKEGSKGYQAMDAVSKVFHAAQLARTLIETSALAIKGVVNQAGGDVYSAIPRMAAMAAIMAGLGYATGMFGSSGSGGMKAADVQKTQGSGSVFGDSEAKSDSVRKSLELLKSSFDKLYPVNQGMLKALQSIENSMTGLTNLVVRSGGVAEGTNMGIATGQLNAKGSAVDSISRVMTKVTEVLFPIIGEGIAKFINNLWGKTTQNIIDSGIQFGGSLSGMKQGQGFNQYASVDTTKSSWFGLSKKTSNTVQTQGLNEEISKQLGMVFGNMQIALEEAGKALFGSSDGITKALDSLVLTTNKISLKGLTGQALTDAINAVVSKGLDEMAAAAFKGFEEFQKVGEGMSQTVLRVANNFATMNATLTKLNLTTFETSMAGIKASDSFLKLFDSLEEFQSASSAYYDKFFTEAEKNEKVMNALKIQFQGMNLELPNSIKAYRQLVETTTDPVKLAALLKLSGAFAELFGTASAGTEKMKEAIDETAKSAERWLSIRNQAASLQDSINSAMGNPERDPAVRMKKLWDDMAADITPEQKLALAGELKDLVLAKYQVEKEAMTKLIEFGKQLRSYVESLKVGSLSPLTLQEKLLEAKKQYEATLAKAQGGDVTAQGALQGKSDTYLQLAQTALASSGQYQEVFNTVTNSLDALGVESMSAADKANQIASNQLEQLQKLKDYVNSIEITSDRFYNESIAKLSSQVLLLDAMNKKLGVLDSIAVTLAGMSAQIAAAVVGKTGSGVTTGITGTAQDFITSLYQQYAGRSASQIDVGGMEYWKQELLQYGKEYVTKAFIDSVNRVTPAPAPANNALISEIKSLKEEVAGLRADSGVNTMNTVQAIITSNNDNAKQVVEGTNQNRQTQSWVESNSPALV
jgi:tape measure domain-containing protein